MTTLPASSPVGLPDPSRSPVPPSPWRWPLLGAQLAVTSWAAFWLWFISAVIISEWSAGAWTHGPAIAAPILAATILAWLRPRLGGAALVLAGGVAMWFFPHPGAQSLLAAPPIVLGLLILDFGWRRVTR